MADIIDTPTSPKAVVSLSPAAKHKVVLLGNQAVGKTSIIHRLHKDTFTSEYTVSLSQVLIPPIGNCGIGLCDRQRQDRRR